jgi:hypothetical protein
MDESTCRVFLDAKPNPVEKVGVHPHTPLATTIPTTLALTLTVCWITIGVYRYRESLIG